MSANASYNFRRVLLASGKDKSASVKSNKSGKEISVEDVEILVPRDDAAADYVLSTLEAKVIDAQTGTEITLKGKQAAAVRAIRSAFETVRGKAREKMDAGATSAAVGDYVRAEALKIHLPDYSSAGAAKAPISGDALKEEIARLVEDGMDQMEAMLTAMRSLGVNVK